MIIEYTHCFQYNTGTYVPYKVDMDAMYCTCMGHVFFMATFQNEACDSMKLVFVVKGHLTWKINLRL